MRKTLLLLCAAMALSAQTPPPQQGFRKEMLVNEHVRIVSSRIPAHASMPVHRHDHDFLVVPLDDARLLAHEEGKPDAEVVLRRGEPAMVKGGFTHSETNESDRDVRVTVVEFMAPQGAVKRLDAKPSRYCTPGSKTACVTENYLFCSEKVCVSEVEFGPGAVTLMHRHSTAHMLIAVTDLNMKDEPEGQPAVQRDQKSGEVIYLPAGITHALVNGPQPARFITVVWK